MSTIAKTIGIVDFEVSEVGPAKLSETPVEAPVVRFVLRQWTGTENGAPIISGDLASEDQIDQFVMLLRANLDEAARRAKAQLRRVQNSN